MFSDGGRATLVQIVWRRLFLGLLTLILLSFVIFIATAVLPGDAARAILGRTVNQQALETLRAQLALTDPVLVRYWHWLGFILHGDFGYSLINGQPVLSVVGPRLWNSINLLVISSCLTIPASLALAVWAASVRGHALDNALSSVALIIAALPEFIVGIVLIFMFATVVFQWLPPVSMVVPGISPVKRMLILALPALTLSLVCFPYIFRMMRAALIEVLDSHYIEIATLKGLSAGRITLVHALPNAIAPSLQVIALTLGYLSGGTVMVEYVFGYAGIGQGLMNAIAARDVPMIQCIVLLLASFYVLINIAADVATILATPRLRTTKWRPE